MSNYYGNYTNANDYQQQNQWAAGGAQSTTPSFGNPPQQQVQQQQPQQQQQAMPSLWNPNTAATMAAVAGSVANSGLSNDAMFDLASTAGKSFLQSSTARMIPGLESFMVTLRAYFAVDNQYVVKKMKKILLPFLSKYWKRTQKEPPGPNTPPIYELPLFDENAPDLYIPGMSLITYVLLCALCYGTAGNFDPEVIPDVTTKCFVLQIIEVLLIRFGFYMMQASVAIIDLFSYTGYKYLGLCINMMVGLILGHFDLGARGYYITFLWTASAASFFMLKTMANNIPMVTSATGPKREVVVLVIAASQFASMWIVSQTKFL